MIQFIRVITSMIKAVFFDIDGTLCSFKTHKVSNKTKQALLKLKENGIRIFVATGRGKDGLKILDDIPFDGYITLNGQYCFTKDEVIYSNTMSKEDLSILLKELETHPFPCGFTLENDKFFNYRDQRVDEIHAITQNDDHPAKDCSNIINEKVYQVMAFIDVKEEIELMKKMINTTSGRWYPTFCDLSPLGGTKVKGIDHFLNYYGLSLDDTVAFGDGGNDIQMLKHVHTSIAMGNASDEVKSVCDIITDTVDNEGIEKALIELGIIQ